jgi:hypothetical protein
VSNLERQQMAYNNWKKMQTKSEQEGKKGLCQVCRDAVGVYFNFQEVSYGKTYCAKCYEAKYNKSLDPIITNTVVNIDLLPNIIKPKIMNHVKDSYVAINLMTADEKRKKHGYNISLIGWYGNNLQNVGSVDNRDINPIFDQHQLVYEPDGSYWLETYIKRIRSAWVMASGLMKHILQFHKIEGSVIPGKDYWDSTKLKRNVLNYHVPHDLSVAKIIERIENYYLKEGNYLGDKTMQELVDIIYDNDILLWNIQNSKKVKCTDESKYYYRKMALKELDKRMDPVVTTQVCQVIIKSTKKYEFLKELSIKILKENEEAYKFVLPHYLKQEFKYPPKK